MKGIDWDEMLMRLPLDAIGDAINPSGETWRDMMLDQYARDFVKKGGIGIAAGIAGELIKIQEGRSA